ncbi:hypothetical protein M2347_002011 [Chryseobacterium sp. H1D6B]|uniref:hypothetical protein n=1 Tax=Chryseobacterium sp. H1D6B TaxID=2940588 RepID=UPI0015CCC4DB|nr:hypothetical protein [Chryseobacterium sp. H1D6B]MDH6252284.1 hypothetical protein [Chryseobacterium sp. H1D6B]
MTTKKILTLFLLVISIHSYFSQEVEIKDDKVLLDGKPILKAEKINPMQYSFYSLGNDDEILLYKAMNNETPKYTEDDYYILNFLTEKVKVESRDFTKILNFMNSKKGMEKLVKWLLKEKVINGNGELNPERLAIFKEKYDENITERTIR